jgi:hypothetical protein
MPRYASTGATLLYDDDSALGVCGRVYRSFARYWTELVRNNGEDGPFALRLVCRPPWAYRVLVGARSPVTCVAGVSSLGPFAGICWWLSVVFAGLMCGEPGWPKGS